MSARACTWGQATWLLPTRRRQLAYPRRPITALLANPAHPWTAQRDFFPESTWDQFVPLERALQEDNEVSYV